MCARVIHDIERLHKIAANHYVNLDVDDDGVLWAGCTDTGDAEEHCGARWPVPLTAGGRTRKYWWACPNECNLTEVLAVARINAMAEGRAPFDPDAARRYFDFLMSRERPKRKFWRYDILDRIEQHEALMELFTAEWTPELNAAYDEFDPD